MAARKKARPGLKLDLGASVLAAAKGADGRWTKEGLPTFRQAHRKYVAAQRDVDAAQSALKAARARVRTLHALQNDAVEKLAVALCLEGHRRKNPFKRFGAPSPSTIGRLATADGVAAIARLVASVVRREGLRETTTHAAEAALAAARAVEQAVAAVAKLEHDVRDALATRDAVGVDWDSAVSAFRSRVLAAQIGDGLPGLYDMLFPRTRRTARKREVSVPPADVEAPKPLP
jgi:hypothetical protein